MVSRRTLFKRVTAGVLALGAAAALMVVGPSSALATQGYCGLTWGSGAKTLNPPIMSGQVTDVRAGRHDCYDRLVVDVRASGVHGYIVQYIDELYQDGSGTHIPLRGGAKLAVVALADAYDEAGTPTYWPANRAELVNVAGWQTFRQVAWAGSFEGTSTVGIGVRARLPFRVSIFDGPAGGSRLVVDVAHFW
ncbi:MAG: hypothetical protein M3548_01930 [Actinomycetota bacterium]|nr:hypothetical protein [Actinomycetota bacterium]